MVNEANTFGVNNALKTKLIEKSMDMEAHLAPQNGRSNPLVKTINKQKAVIRASNLIQYQKKQGNSSQFAL